MEAFIRAVRSVGSFANIQFMNSMIGPEVTWPQTTPTYGLAPLKWNNGGRIAIDFNANVHIGSEHLLYYWPQAILFVRYLHTYLHTVVQCRRCPQAILFVRVHTCIQ